MLGREKLILRFLPSLQLSRKLHTRPGRLRCYPSGREDNDEDVAGEIEGDRKANIYFYKSRGQHILTNPRILDTIVRKSLIKPTDTVLEIGPGTGNLTLKLLEAAENVVAIEIDERMVEVLQKRVTEKGFEDKLNVICGDALRTEFPPFDLVVANIPYQISSPLVMKLLFGENKFRSATLLLQKEFARRLLANSGDSEFNRLAINVKLVADVEHVMDVSKRDFVPCPKVDSSVVIIRPKALVPEVNINEWWAFTRTCFGKKNKTLGATLKQKKKVMELLNLSNVKGSSLENGVKCNNNSEDERDCLSSKAMCLMRDNIIGVLKMGGFEEKRPSKMSVVELLGLLSLFNQAGIYFHDHSKLKSGKSIAISDDAYP